MFDPSRTDLYPKNEDGNPDFASILLTIDASLIRPGTPEVVQKMVLSTESSLAAVSSLLIYYGQHSISHTTTFMEMIQASGREKNPVFVYLPENGITQIVLDLDLWDALVASPAFGKGSLLLASEAIQEQVARMCQAQLESSGVVSRLFFFDVSPKEPEVQSQEAGEERAQGGQGDPAPQ